MASDGQHRPGRLKGRSCTRDYDKLFQNTRNIKMFEKMLNWYFSMCSNHKFTQVEISSSGILWSGNSYFVSLVQIWIII